jgi:hypothetical protein
MSDRLVMEQEVEGLARPVLMAFEFKAPDQGCGQPGGYFMAFALLNTGERVIEIYREEFRALFGRTALQAAEEQAESYALEAPEPVLTHEEG